MFRQCSFLPPLLLIVAMSGADTRACLPRKLCGDQLGQIVELWRAGLEGFEKGRKAFLLSQ